MPTIIIIILLLYDYRSMRWWSTVLVYNNNIYYVLASGNGDVIPIDELHTLINVVVNNTEYNNIIYEQTMNIISRHTRVFYDNCRYLLYLLYIVQLTPHVYCYCSTQNIIQRHRILQQYNILLFIIYFPFGHGGRRFPICAPPTGNVL